MAQLARDAYPTRKYNGEIYTFYVSRANKGDVALDKKALVAHGYKYRVLTLRNAKPGLAKYIVFKRKK